MNYNDYTLSSEYILRTPIFSFDNLYQNIDLEKLLNNQIFIESIYTSSIPLFEEIMKFKKKSTFFSEKEKNRLFISIYKYYLRATTRSTPYSTFSRIGTGNIVKYNTPGVKINSNIILRNVSIDSQFTIDFIKEIKNINYIKEKLLYKKNPSIYRVGSEFRYIENNKTLDDFHYSISSIKKDEIISLILNSSNEYNSIQHYAKLISNIYDFKYDEIISYLNNLIDNDILVDNFNIKLITNDSNYIEYILHFLKNISFSNTELYLLLTNINDILKSINTNFDINTSVIHLYEEIKILFKKIVDLDIDKYTLFKIDSYYKSINSSISSSIFNNISNVIPLLTAISTQKKDPLQNLKSRFFELYEDEYVPISIFLDDDIGINLNQVLKEPIYTNHNSVDEFLLKKLIDNPSQNINLYDNDINKFTETDYQDDILSRNLFFKSVSIDDKEYILLNSICCNSAVDLLARFSTTNDNIYKIINNIKNHEQNIVSSNTIIADIAHIPKKRLANITSRKKIFDYSITYLGDSDVKNIDINDIYVTLYNNSFILRSKSLNKYILPRLSNVHNHSLSELPVYRFLCLIQNQNKNRFINFEWGHFSNFFNFLPRVQYKNIILHPNTWFFNKTDLDELSFYEWHKKNNLPKEFILKNGDNELYVNSQNKFFIKVFIEEIKNKSTFTIQEFFKPSKIVSDQNGNKFCNEFIVPIYNTNPYINNYKLNRKIINTKKRIINSIDGCFYIKLYGGKNITEEILIKKLFPILSKLSKTDKISKWFFIRYNDPNFHLRIRFFCNDDDKYMIFNKINKLLNKYISTRYIHDYSLNNYKREIERYGLDIELSESYFFIDSQIILKFLTKFSDENESYRMMFILKYFYSLFNFYNFSLNEIKEFIQERRLYFFQEFNGDKFLNRDLSNHYRANREYIEIALNSPFKKINNNSFNSFSNKLIHKRNEMLSEHNITKRIIKNNLASYIHMNVNRMYKENPRRKELIIYDTFDRYYKFLSQMDNYNSK